MFVTFCMSKKIDFKHLKQRTRADEIGKKTLIYKKYDGIHRIIVIITSLIYVSRRNLRMQNTDRLKIFPGGRKRKYRPMVSRQIVRLSLSEFLVGLSLLLWAVEIVSSSCENRMVNIN